jgi:hypothetical protein
VARVDRSGIRGGFFARKSGQLMPHDLAGEAQVPRWSFTALTTIEVPLLSLRVCQPVRYRGVSGAGGGSSGERE